MSRTVRRPLALIAAGVTGLLAASAVTIAAAASTSPAAAPRWRITAAVKTSDTGIFTAVVATGKTTGWAFDGTGSATPPSAYRLSGPAWKKAPFPGKADETVITAAATSPTDVWAFTRGFSSASRVLRYNGHAWSVVKTFADEIAYATVLASNDVWVYGQAGIPGFQPALGVWHYNGATWTKLAQGSFGNGPEPEFSADGSGGLWLPMTGPVGGPGHLVHYAAGRLTAVTLPVSAAKITVMAVSRIPGTAQQLAGGDTHGSSNGGANVVGVLLKYS